MKNAPSTDQYVTVLKELGPLVTANHRSLFAAHYHAPRRTATAKQLALLAGLGNKAIVVNGIYGSLGRRVCTKLGIRPELRPDSSYRWWSTWSAGRSRNRSFEWRMRPAFAKALVKLGWVNGGKRSGGTPESRASRATFLLEWNPRHPHRWHDFGEEFKVHGGRCSATWSCGRSQAINIGDRLFLLRVGVEPKGVVAAGIATSGAFLDKHWDKDRRAQGDRTHFVECDFDTVLDPAREKILTIADIERARIGSFNWTPQSSGVRIPDPIATKLEQQWATFLRIKRRPLLTLEAMAVEGAMTEQLHYVRGRNRALRDKVIAASNGSCQACGVNYRDRFEGRGSRVLQVHHKKQLAISDAPRLTRTSDLVVLCANCHCLIHMNPLKALTLSTLVKMLRVG